MADFDYELFISYSHQDGPWAIKLYQDLVASGIDPASIFFDRERLDPGVLWRTKLDMAILKTRQLILLWSDNVRKSDWVAEEGMKFRGTLKFDASGQPLNGQRLLFIPLEGDNPVYSQYQIIDNIKKANAYPGDCKNVDPNVWKALIEQIVRSVSANADFKPIRLAVLAMTRDRIKRLNLRAELPDHSILADAVRRMGLTIQIDLLDHLDPNLTLPQGNTLGQALAELGFQTEPDPDEPGQIRVILGGGETLGQALARLGLVSMDDLLGWLEANRGVQLPNGQTLDAALMVRWMGIRPEVENLMIKIALRRYYGDMPLDWRPFGSPSYRISTIMSKVKSEFNRRLVTRGLADKRFRWELAGDFWSETADAEDERNMLATKRAVIVVDPLSLYDEEVNRRFASLLDAFRNENALIMAFAPFALPTPTGVMRTLINDKAIKLFRSFYQPRVIAETTMAKCGPDVGDEVDISRWLLTALWPQGGGAAAAGAAQATAEQEAAAIMRPRSEAEPR